MFRIAKWFKNYQAPVVLMIDDLSDAYIDVYPESYKNDWGYLCDSEGSSYHFLKKELLALFPYIKITFFVPYLKHNVINENSTFKFKKYSLGERIEYTKFLIQLDKEGHEIAHHGSNHGKYIDENIPTTVNNWTHEWGLFKDVESGVKITLTGLKIFKEICDIDIVGGKYCGYISIDNSQEIIDKCNFLYWCERPNFNFDDYGENFFGENEIISFPTTVPGNSFVRLSYITGIKQKDKAKKILKYFQPFYNILSYIRVYKHYIKNHIISIQEHNSPSKTSGMIQSANIISDMKSLHKIFTFLQKFSIWYANCKEIANYIYVREHSKIFSNGNTLKVTFVNSKNLKAVIVSITNEEAFTLEKNNQMFTSVKNNGLHVVNVPIVDGDNIFFIK